MSSPMHALDAARKLVLVASLIWLIVWLAKGTPNLEWFGLWNDWPVALLGCIVFDVFSGPHAAARRRTRD